MNKEEILETLKLAKENSKKRKFSQSVDFVINLKGINLKKPEENLNSFVNLPFHKGKHSKVAALVGDELVTKAKKACEIVITKDEFYDYGTNPKKTKKMAKNIDFFLAQANLMPDIAKAFGKVLGPIGKMPNPKAGAVVPPVIPDLKPIIEKMQNMVKIQTKNEPSVKVMVGVENMNNEELVENIIAVYNNVFHFYHDDRTKIKNAMLKFSMGKPFIIGKKYTKEELEVKTEKKKKGIKKGEKE